MIEATVEVDPWDVIDQIDDDDLLEEAERRHLIFERKTRVGSESALLDAVADFHDTEGHPCALRWCLHSVCRKHPSGYESAREQWGRGR